MTDYDLWLLPDDDEREEEPKIVHFGEFEEIEADSEYGGDCEYWQRVMRHH